MPYSTFERFELELSLDQARQGSLDGQCDSDIAELRATPQSRLNSTRQPTKVADELREYGAWEDDELTDHEANLNRILWLACGQIVDETEE